MNEYIFPVLAYEVADGDTYRLTVEVTPARSAFRVDIPQVTAKVEVRLWGWDCPESRSLSTRKVGVREKAAAVKAKAAANAWFAENVGRDIQVKTEKDPEKYGRWLGTITSLSSDLGMSLNKQGLAVPYYGTSADKRWYQTRGRKQQ